MMTPTPARMIMLFTTSILISVFVIEMVHADSMRCGQRVVRTGDSPAVLLARCGEPFHRGKGYAQVKTEGGRKKVRVDQWHYKKNDRSLERIVLIYQGEIVRVETGGR